MLGERAPIEHYDVAKWMRTVHVNVNVPFILTKSCLPLLKRSADPVILFTSSGVGKRGRAYWGAITFLVAFFLLLLLVFAAPTLACGGLIGPNGAVNLLRAALLRTGASIVVRCSPLT